MTDNDREMLELAAKAAGFEHAVYQDMQGWGEVRYGYSHAIWTGDDYWNPLENDGDAFRLMVALDIDIRFYRKHVDANCDSRAGSIFKEHGKDRAAATRNAIVMAAAEIGRGMKDAPLGL